MDKIVFKYKHFPSIASKLGNAMYKHSQRILSPLGTICKLSIDIYLNQIMTSCLCMHTTTSRITIELLNKCTISNNENINLIVLFVNSGPKFLNNIDRL